ncbi:MAG: T9SS type A sorting domain-containing protein, partial [Bacteroidia bacterium]|nr:T9SS type A sorting domain-containing protein [Bacteroidia bacterium]
GAIDLDGSFYLEGNWTNNATTGNVFINNTGPAWGIVVFSGTNPQTIQGTATTVFERLEIWHSRKTLKVDNVQVNKSIKLVGSDLLLNHNTFIVNNADASSINPAIGSGIISEDSTSGFGIVKWNIGTNTTLDYVIPFETIGGSAIPFTYRPNSGTTGSLSLATYATPVSNHPLPPTVNHLQDAATGADNANIVVDRFWNIDVTGSPNADLTFYGTAGEASSTTNPRAQRWIASNDHWEAPQGIQSNPTTYSARAQGITNFNTWWILAPLANPLPVELLGFRAVCNNNNVEIGWATATETNNDYFTLERSIDGVNFETLAFVNGAGNSNTAQNYMHVDNNPAKSTMYYRLTQTDFNGAFEVFDPISITPCSKPNHWNLVSAHGSNSTLRIILESGISEELDIKVYDMLGNEVFQTHTSLFPGYQAEQFNTKSMKPGVYFITCKSSTYTDKMKFVVQ